MITNHNSYESTIVNLRNLDISASSRGVPKDAKTVQRHAKKFGIPMDETIVLHGFALKLTTVAMKV